MPHSETQGNAAAFAGIFPLNRQDQRDMPFPMIGRVCLYKAAFVYIDTMLLERFERKI